MEKHLYAEMSSLEEAHWWFRGRRAVLFDLLSRFKPMGKRLLDVGVGTGINAQQFSQHGFLVDAIEPSQEAIRFAKEKAPSANLIEASFPSPLVKDNEYHIVTLLDVLEHFDDDHSALRAVTKALAPGGIVLITVPAFRFLWSGHDELAHHRRRYRKAELVERLKGAGLTPAFVSYYNFFLFPAIALVRLASNALNVRKKESDFSSTPGFLNAPLALLFGFERFLLRVGPLPWGVSLIAVARKVQ